MYAYRIHAQVSNRCLLPISNRSLLPISNRSLKRVCLSHTRPNNALFKGIADDIANARRAGDVDEDMAIIAETC